MPSKLLRHIPTGVVFVNQPAFAVRADFEEIPDEEPVVEKTAPAPRRSKAPAPPAEPAPGLPDPDTPAIDEAALSADASRNQPA